MGCFLKLLRCYLQHNTSRAALQSATIIAANRFLPNVESHELANFRIHLKNKASISNRQGHKNTHTSLPSSRTTPISSLMRAWRLCSEPSRGLQQTKTNMLHMPEAGQVDAADAADTVSLLVFCQAGSDIHGLPLLRFRPGNSDIVSWSELLSGSSTTLDTSEITTTLGQ